MVRIALWKSIIIVLVSLYGVLLALPNVVPNLPSFLPQRTINLGLDLQGGSHLLLQVDMDQAMSDRMQALADAMSAALAKENISYQNVNIADDQVSLNIANLSTQRDLVYKTLRAVDALSEIEIDESKDLVAYRLNEKDIRDFKAGVIAHSIEIIRRRIDETGTKEPLIQRQGDDRIVLQLPGIQNPEDVKKLLGKTAKMTFHLVDDVSVDGNELAFSSRLLPLAEGGGQIAIRKRVLLTGEMLVDAQAVLQQGQPVVSFKFDSLGAQKFCDITRENVNKPFAIVLDNVVISAPRINEAICGGSGIISGSFDVKSANELALLLRAGALPAPLTVVEERSVGPSLGADSIEAGKKACTIALILVILYMVATYGRFGVFASIALLFNIVFMISCYSLLQATLTMPGIAGIILTVGMAVDANVLIFERIREELRAGRSVIGAIDKGYGNAIGTIIDSNITTLIAAALLFMFGSGPVKGFGVALTIGIVTSMFTAIMLTRLIIVTWLNHAKPKSMIL
jgi:preprotein translocase subunit SecD